MLRRCAAILAWSLVLIAQAPAQTKPPQPYLALKEGYQVFVLGDSLAAGLWSGLTRASNGDDRLAIDGRYKEDSGLARPEYYDWNLALPKILKSNRIDIAVVMIGTNDAQDIRDGNLRHVFGTAEWNTLYAAQVDRLIQNLKQAGAAVYWVELPPMAAGDYDAETKAISAIQAERAKAAGVKFVATRATFAAKDGGYTDRGFDDSGEFVRLRSRDGVHFLKQGNNRLGGLVLDTIKADMGASAESAEQPPAEEVTPNGPAFGQAASDGEGTVVYLQPPEPSQADPHLAKNDFADGGEGSAQSAGLTGVARTAVAGSSAAKLFTLGESPAPKPGRFDDFSIAP